MSKSSSSTTTRVNLCSTQLYWPKMIEKLSWISIVQSILARFLTSWARVWHLPSAFGLLLLLKIKTLWIGSSMEHVTPVPNAARQTSRSKTSNSQQKMESATIDVSTTFLECYLHLECLGKVAKDNLCQITYQLLPLLKNHLLLKVEVNPLYENLKVWRLEKQARRRCFQTFTLSLEKSGVWSL